MKFILGVVVGAVLMVGSWRRKMHAVWNSTRRMSTPKPSNCWRCLPRIKNGKSSRFSSIEKFVTRDSADWFVTPMTIDVQSHDFRW